MIDNNGYRLNVGIVLCNTHQQVLWARKCKQHYCWQFPQGGINIGETPEQAMYRELFEEIGLNYQDVRILSSTQYWMHYKLPKKLIRWKIRPICFGQKQKWFLLKLLSKDTRINIKNNKDYTFDSWKWVSLWYPIRRVVFFKRDVYRKVMQEFVDVIIS
ncbi:RNA pyrophosphohydrolase [Blochmannia endosymbiont of Camponotus modoc]|uniref:RNA pyrophosphohydrolase n=1 Tax=Blochmannia endosymbiont of Camponotus modoc TaxID=2945587 RepID=UPI0020252AE6|nr:RNA pyrophosphohydrolase [Blochmannia endosymbiont of Camponotus modoc]URJ26509.1 RNA pyrophosphohydrolase [Blochmannia endosymbiont of Camponotus modoc]URJ32012.1 RNA pyrophosphohydrolase [Blochmannia endosymbiont of Camponotus modoc]